uniref:Reverse transcriptase domain-containing protein n=1 Tax=Xenopus tropicalis TaxID=8364 RepID=A0A803K2N6_XENTR
MSLAAHPEEVTKLKKKSDFTPSYGISQHVSVFKDMVSEAFINLDLKYHPDNLTKLEREALRDIKSWKDVQIKPSDKGGNIVIWANELYILEAKRQLHSQTYRRLYSNPSDTYMNNYNRIIEEASKDLLISNQEKTFLIANSPRIATFYLLPKIHKNSKKPPGRPIVSGNGNLTENASKYIDQQLRRYVTALPSYVKDTTEVLAKLEGIHVVKDTWLVTLDVETLYTSIRHQDGIEAVKYFLDTDSTIDQDKGHFLIKLLNFILQHNYFIFNNSFY